MQLDRIAEMVNVKGILEIVESLQFYVLHVATRRKYTHNLRTYL